MSKKTSLRYCSISSKDLLEKYKGLIVKIAQKTLTEKDVEGFPLDYSPKNGKLYLSMTELPLKSVSIIFFLCLGFKSCTKERC